jgi:hypothetical protein
MKPWDLLHYNAMYSPSPWNTMPIPVVTLPKEPAPYNHNRCPSPIEPVLENIATNMGFSSDSSVNLTPPSGDEKETLQSDSFHSEEKPATTLLKTKNTTEQQKSSTAVGSKNQTNGGDSPRKQSLMSPSISTTSVSEGQNHHQNQRKVSTSSSVTSSPKRARIMNTMNNNNKYDGAYHTNRSPRGRLSGPQHGQPNYRQVQAQPERQKIRVDSQQSQSAASNGSNGLPSRVYYHTTPHQMKKPDFFGRQYTQPSRNWKK